VVDGIINPPPGIYTLSITANNCNGIANDFSGISDYTIVPQEFWRLNGNDITIGDFIGTRSTSSEKDFVIKTDGIQKMIVKGTGEVGIGVNFSNPANLLSVAGSAALGVFFSTITAPANGLIVQGRTGIGVSNPAAKLEILDGTTQLRLTQIPGNVFTDFQITAAGNLFINPQNSGNPANVGIGTSVPQNTLSVAGAVGIGAVFAGASAPANGLIVEGRTGIGVSSPAAKLEILDASTTQLRLTHTAGTIFTDSQTTSAGNLFINPQKSGNPANVGIITNVPTSSLSVAGGVGIGINFASIVGGAPANGLIVEGDVGIGVAAPVENLHVAGRIRSNFLGGITTNPSIFTFPFGLVVANVTGTLLHKINFTADPNEVLLGTGNFGAPPDDDDWTVGINTTVLTNVAHNLGIGTTSPVANLHLVGTLKL